MDALSITRAADRWTGRPFVVAEGHTWTFADLATRARTTLTSLRDLGASIETPIAFDAPPSIATIVVILAAFEGGIPFAPLHPRWTASERARALSIVANAIVVDATRLDRTAPAPPAPLPDPRLERRSEERLPELDEDTLATILFTSGTSAQPKGVRLARRCFVASARAHADNIPFIADDRWLLAMPIAHAGGLSIVTRALLSGTAIVVQPSFDPAAVLDAIERDGVTLLSVVPAMLAKLLASSGHERLRGLRAILVGGAPFSPALRARAAEAGVTALATYGLTETCSQVVTQPPKAAGAAMALDSGRVLAGADLRIAGADDAGVGRIQVRGDMVMLGYVGHPPHARGAWLDTRDAGWIDDRGRLVVLGRADDTIVTGGENVHPSEVEQALERCHGVREVAVFGCPDDTWGQTVSAALVLEDGVDARQVLEQAAARLAPFKRPRRYIVVSALATREGAKVSRRALAEQHREALVAVSYGASGGAR